VSDQPRPHQRDDDHRREQADAEHRVAPRQQRQPRLPSRGVRHEQRPVRRGHHRRDDGHQPAAERAVCCDLMPRHHQVRDPAGGDEPERGPQPPQRPVGLHRRAEPQPVPADQQRPAADGHQRHRRRPPVLRHDRVGRVRERPLPVPDPLRRERTGEDDEQHGGQRPHRQRERAQPGDAQRQRRRRDRHDPGAHDGREPVRCHAANDVSQPVLLFLYPERARPTLQLIDHDIEHHRDPPLRVDTDRAWSHNVTL